MRSLMLVLVIGCATHLEPATFAQTETGSVHSARPAPPASPAARLRYHMRDHLRDLRESQRLLVHGRLEEARLFTYWMTRLDRHLAWTSDTARVVQLADRFAAPDTSAAEARELLPALARACGTCHRRLDVTPQLTTPSLPEPHLQHAWAADRMLEGLATGSEARWQEGLDVLAVDEQPELKTHARALAEPAADRTAEYTRMLGTCTGCHTRAKE